MLIILIIGFVFKSIFVKMSKRRRRKKRVTKSALKVAKIALRRVNKLRKQIEVKTSVVLENTQTFNPAGSVFFLAGIPQGIDSAQRIGSEVYLLSHQIRFKIQQPATNLNIAHSRIIFFTDMRQEAKLAPVTTDVLLEAKAFAMRTQSIAKRFRIYYDRTFATGINSGRQSLVKVLFQKIRMNVNFDGPLATDILRHGFYMLLIGDQAVNVNTMTFSCQIWYTDA